MPINLNIVNENLFFYGELWIDFFSRFFVNLLAIFILIRFIYYPQNGQAKYMFTFFMTGLMIFLIAASLDRVTLDIGIAFGLFAIFGIVRFRTPSIEIKEITYILIVIGISIMNALVDFRVSEWFGLTFVNVIVLGFAYIMENYRPRKIILKNTLTFKPANFRAVTNDKYLMEEIKRLTGFRVFKIDITKINHTSEEITVLIYYKVDGFTQIKRSETQEKLDSNYEI